MRWPWSKRRQTEADDACREAHEGLQDAKDRWPEVYRVSSSLRELRERNHFAETINATFRGERP